MLTYALFNETGKEETEIVMEEKVKDADLNAAVKRTRRTDRNKPKNNIEEVDDEESLSSLNHSGKKKTKKEVPEEDVEQMFRMEVSDPTSVNQEQKKFIFKIIYDNTKNREFSTIHFDELWTLVSKNKDFSKHNIKSKSDLLNIVAVLDANSRCQYSEKDNNITLV